MVVFLFEKTKLFKMIGISEECFQWIYHQYFWIIRKKGKVNLRKVIIPNNYYDGFIIISNTELRFNMEKSYPYQSAFLSINVKNMILEWFLFLGLINLLFFFSSQCCKNIIY
jgi:hypothetical protein